MPSVSAVPAMFMNGVISAIDPQSITRAPNAAAILSRTPGTDAPGSPEKNIVFSPNACGSKPSARATSARCSANDGVE